MAWRLREAGIGKENINRHPNQGTSGSREMVRAKKPRRKGAKPLNRKHAYQGGQDDAKKKEGGDCVWVLYEGAKEEGEEKSSDKLDVSIF